ncbi:tape measure protein [Mammaliicoccus sciuri]
MAYFLWPRKEGITISDGTISIKIEVDGKQIDVASKELDKLEDAGLKSGKGIKAAEDSMDSLGDASAKASSSVKDTGNAIEGLGDSGAKAGKDLKGTDSAIDGIADSSAQAASGVKGFSDSLDGVSDKAAEAANGTQKVKEEAASVSQETVKASIGVKELATSLGLVAIASKAFSTMKSSLDSAISRFDTLNSFPKVLQALGVSAEDSERAMSNLSDGIDGLPTTLNDIAASAQRMYTSFGDMDVATDAAIALNNALLGSGSNAEQAQRGMDQYTKALQSGSITMDTWNTLSETMDVGLIKIAEGFGYAGKSAKDDLYNALKVGTITMDQFNAKLIEVGTGTGIMATLARENSLGIATSLSNLRNATSRGVANIIDSFNKLAEDTTGKNIAQNIDSLKAVVNSSFKVMGTVIEGTAPIVKMFAATVQTTIPVVKALSPAIIGLMTAYGAYLVITKAGAAIQTSNAVLAIAISSSKTLTVVTRAQMTAQVASTTATAADTVAKAAQAGTIKLSTLAIGVMTGTIKLSTAAQIIGTTASYAFGAAIKFLTGPIGWVVAGLGLLTAGVIAVVKWFNKTSEEANRLNAETEELTASVSNLNSSIEENSRAHKESIGDIEANRQKNEELMKTVDELASKENKSAAEKQILAGYINELNDSVEGLNLSYNNEANALNLSSEELSKRIELMAEQERFSEAMERQVEITKEQFEIESRLDEITAKRNEWKEAVEAGGRTAGAAKEKIAELQVEEDGLKVTSAELAEEYDRTMTIIAEATANGVSISVDALQEWIGKNEELLGSMGDAYNEILDITTNAFSKISDKSKVTEEELFKNLQHNQQMTADWAKNISELYEFASEKGHEGFMRWLEKLGPDSAAEVAVISNMSEPELKKFANMMDEGAIQAGDNFKTGLGEGFEGVADVVIDLVDSNAQSMREQIKAADFESIGESVPEGMDQGVKKGAPKVEKSAEEMAQNVIDKAKTTLGTNSPSKEFQKIGDSIPEGLELGVNKGSPKVINTMKKLALELLKPFDKTPSQLEVIGGQAIAGFNRGLSSGEGAVMATARRIANNAASTMRQALDIHSPSRVFEEIGKFTGQGLTVGMLSTITENEKAASAVAKAMTTKTREILVKSAEESRNQIKEIEQKSADEIKQIRKRSAEDIQNIHAKAKKAKRKITQAEAIRIRRIEEDSAKKIKNISSKSAADILKITSGSESIRIKNLQTFISDKRKLEQISLRDEVAIWRESVKHFKKGTDEKRAATLALRDARRAVDQEVLDDGLAFIDEKKRQGEISLADEIKLLNELEKQFVKAAGNSKYEEIQRRKATVLQQVYNEMDSINKEHLGKAKQISDDLIANIQRVEDEYQKALDSRESAIKSYFSVFDRFEVGEPVMTIDLMRNLNEQVVGLQRWQKEIADLAHKAIDEGLLDELRQLGPKALPELQALNSMTGEQLTNYSNLYKQKTAIAREQAELELQGMKKDTEKRIEEMRNAANKELDVLEKEWIKKIKGVTTETDTVLKTLKDVGTNAGKGLMEGLASMQGPLVSKARDIANSVKREMTKALDIHSPSRWMRDMIGKNMMLGWMQGIDFEKSATLRKAREAAEWMKPDISTATKWSGIAIPNINLAPLNTTPARVATKSTSNSGSQDNRMGDLIDAVNRLASRPASFEIDGIEVVRAISSELNNDFGLGATASAYVRGGSFK